ncbi:hypothetical protein HJC23_014054 [Cyclotella cryptica]|uniref:Bacterial surface antigen (D15) domain-containing protein n=1 Tax=Cyclotella cryptica TaxID=29204 RepID=A0ABD3QU84_9STRA|eukprot:CCRYP_002448-RA/>CCRYP_002448-RA protein AED:0.03 eAED:0.03 QI:61/1/1/1/1/1/2/93/670
MSNNNHGGQRQQDENLFVQLQRQKQAQLERIRQQQIVQKLNELRATFLSEYPMPLKYPALVTSLDDGDVNGGAANKDSSVRTDQDYINARLLEAGLPLGGGIPDVTPTAMSKMTLSEHNNAVARFVHDLEGTGCYDAVQVYFGSNSQASDDDALEDQTPDSFDVTVRLKEKKWYKLYIGGGVNSEDLSSLGESTGGGMGGAFGGMGAAGALPKLQFETSASLLNVTGFADVSTASYSVDQTGGTSFKFTHDRPLCSWVSKQSSLYDWLMPRDPSMIPPVERERYNEQNGSNLDETRVFLSDDAQFSLGGGSHTTLGVHAALDELDYESTRSYREYSRSVGIRLANHCRGASRGPGVGGPHKSSVAPPESMAGPYLYLDWSARLRDVLPRRHADFPFALDCSREVTCHSGTTLKHSLSGGIYLNGCFTDDRYDPTMGYDAHVMGELSGPPGDVGFLKMKGGCSWHWPLELLQMMILGVREGEQVSSNQDAETRAVIGMTFHSSLNAGVINPLTFGGLCNNHAFSGIPLSDRFYVGGPGQLRGFLPAGIGPRASEGGSNAPGGDSLGGDLFYSSTLATSIPFPNYFSTLRQNGARIFGFANIGTCVSTGGANALLSIPAWSQIMRSSRVAVGGGLSLGSPLGRFEATYAVPVRYGPRDARKSVQFGFGFSFG